MPALTGDDADKMFNFESRVLKPPPTRRDRTFAESHPNLIKLAEAVKDTLRDGDHC